MSSSHPSPPNPLIEVVLTIALPSLTLDQLSKPGSVGPFGALLISLIFPLGFGLWCWWRRMGWNFFSVLGLVTILLSGGLGLLKLDAFWFAVKESAVPVMLAVAFPLSHRWGRPLLNSLLLQPRLLNLKVLNRALDDNEKRRRFQHALLRASFGMGMGLLGSAAANFFLALYLLRGKEPGGEAFVRGIGTLTWAGFLVIGVPLMGVMLLVFWSLLRSMESITGLDRNDLLNPGKTVRRQIGTPP